MRCVRCVCVCESINQSINRSGFLSHVLRVYIVCILVVVSEDSTIIKTTTTTTIEGRVVNPALSERASALVYIMDKLLDIIRA